MATVTFACPDCRTNLKTSRRISPDQDVRCPTCGTIFPAPPETNSDLLEFDDEKTGAPAPESENGSEPTTGPQPSSTDDRTAKHSLGSAARRTRRLILGSAVIVVLFTAATTYFAWSAIVNRGHNAGTGHEDPLAYVP